MRLEKSNQMKKLNECAHLLAKPALPKASRPWGGAHVVTALGPGLTLSGIHSVRATVKCALSMR